MVGHTDDDIRRVMCHQPMRWPIRRCHVSPSRSPAVWRIQPNLAVTAKSGGGLLSLENWLAVLFI
jgi:hypothetical protein